MTNLRIILDMHINSVMKTSMHIILGLISKHEMAREWNEGEGTSTLHQAFGFLNRFLLQASSLFGLPSCSKLLAFLVLLLALSGVI